MNGILLVIQQVQEGLTIEQICDRYGRPVRPVHPDAQQFLAQHKQAKRLVIKSMFQIYKKE